MKNKHWYHHSDFLDWLSYHLRADETTHLSFRVSLLAFHIYVMWYTCRVELWSKKGRKKGWTSTPVRKSIISHPSPSTLPTPSNIPPKHHPKNPRHRHNHKNNKNPTLRIIQPKRLVDPIKPLILNSPLLSLPNPQPPNASPKWLVKLATPGPCSLTNLATSLKETHSWASPND